MRDTILLMERKRYIDILILVLITILNLVMLLLPVQNTFAQSLTNIEVVSEVNDLQSAEASLEDVNSEIEILRARRAELNKQIINQEFEDELDEIQAQALVESIQFQIDELESTENTLEEVKEQELRELQSEVVSTGLSIGGWLIVVIGIWFVYEAYVFVLSKFIKSKRIRRVTIRIGFGIALISTITIIVYLLAPQFQLILASLGIVSAALVVAFQDILSSLIAYLMIVGQKLYQKGDVVRFGTSNGMFTGKVAKITPLQTIAEERIDQDDLPQSEQSTNKTLAIPNNTLLKSPIVNFSKESPIIKDQLKFAITFDSDLKVAEKIISDYFRDSDIYFNKNNNTKGYCTEIFLDIVDDGVQFSLWYPAVIGSSRVVRSQHIRALLDIMNENSVELAFKTITISK